MAREWYYLNALREKHGPLSDSQLAKLLRITDAMVWTDGMRSWEAASELFARSDIAGLPELSALDAHGQPRNRAFGSARRLDRGMSELVGLVRGIVADGQVSEGEALALKQWLDANPEVAKVWPAREMTERLGRIFADGRADDEERAELLEIGRRLTGDLPATPSPRGAATRATRLPLTDPVPLLTFRRQTFVFTGRFVFGTRKICEGAVLRLGGLADGGVTHRTDVLVIGILGSEDWVQSTHGRKIEKAVALRESGQGIALVAEEHWSNQLRRVAGSA